MNDGFDEVLGITPGSGQSQAAPAAVLVPAAAGERASADGGAYEAADMNEQGNAMWGPLLRSADLDILPEKDILDAKTRDMLRNDAFVQGGGNLHKDNIVGSHYLLNTRPSSKVLFGKADDVWEAEFQEEVEEKFDLYAESPQNWLDAQRINTFTALVRMVTGIYVAAGEVLATAEWVKGAPFQTAIQLIDLDRLSDPDFLTMKDRENVRGGIRFNSRGAPLSYFIRTEHPSDYYPMSFGTPTWKEVPRTKPWGRMQVLHIYEQTRPDQSRGVAELVTSLQEQKYSRRFRSVQLQRAIMQSLYAAAITSELPKEQIVAAMGGQAMDATACQTAITNYATGLLGAINQYTGAAKQIRLDGARIPVFFPGTKLDMMSPSEGQAMGQEFEQSLLRYIAASLGVSYEQLSRDYTSTNYSSARAAMTETWKFMQSRKKLVADRFASMVFRLWLEEAINTNQIVSFPAKKAGLLYSNGVQNLQFEAISRCDWVGASRGQIDELKETQAAKMRIESGLSTAEDELARLGKDWRKVYRQLKREQEMRETLGLTFTPSDPATVAALTAADPQPAPKDSK